MPNWLSGRRRRRKPLGLRGAVGVLIVTPPQQLAIAGTMLSRTLRNLSEISWNDRKVRRQVRSGTGRCWHVDAPVFLPSRLHVDTDVLAQQRLLADGMAVITRGMADGPRNWSQGTILGWHKVTQRYQVQFFGGRALYFHQDALEATPPVVVQQAPVHSSFGSDAAELPSGPHMRVRHWPRVGPAHRRRRQQEPTTSHRSNPLPTGGGQHRRPYSTS